VIEIIILSFWFSQQVFPANAQDEERAVCDCLNPFDVIAVAFARHLFFGALPILGDVPEVRGDKLFYCSVYLHSIENLFTSLRSNQLIVVFP
jgi:hypothetical protein